MKHVFLIDSHITFYMALSIQQHSKIKIEDVVLVTILGYQPYSKKYNVINLSKFPSLKSFLTEKYVFFNLRYKLIEIHKALKDSFQHTSKIIQGYFRYREIVYNKIVSKNTPYTLYAYHFKGLFSRFLASSSNCKKCYLIEEGKLFYDHGFWKNRFQTGYYTEGYLKRHYKSRLNKLGHFFRFLLKIYSIPPGKPFPGYAIHKDCFPDGELINKTVIPFYKDTSLDLKDITNDATLFFMESISELDFFKEIKIQFYKRLTSVFSRIPSKRIYLKFHIRNTSSTREQTVQAFEKAGKTVKVIEDAIPSEQIFLQKSHLKIYSLRSSVLFYAGIFKAGKVFALEDVFVDLIIKNYLLSPSIRQLLETQATFLKPFSS